MTKPTVKGGLAPANAVVCEGKGWSARQDSNLHPPAAIFHAVGLYPIEITHASGMRDASVCHLWAVPQCKCGPLRGGQR